MCVHSEANAFTSPRDYMPTASPERRLVNPVFSLPAVTTRTPGHSRSLILLSQGGTAESLGQLTPQSQINTPPVSHGLTLKLLADNPASLPRALEGEPGPILPS